MKNRPGQIALIVTLVVIIGLTVAATVLSRSVTTVTIGTQEEERARSFSAAEAGIEDALRQDLSGLAGPQPTFAIGESLTSYSVTRLTNVTSEISPGQTVVVDWSANDVGTTVTVTWDACATLLATEVTSGGGVNHLVNDAGTTEVFTKDEVVDSLLGLRFGGCTTRVQVVGSQELAFYQVDSVGTSGEAVSKVEVLRGAPAAVNLLDFAIFSGGGIN